MQIKAQWHLRTTIWQTCARPRTGNAASGAEDYRGGTRNVDACRWGLNGGITAAKGVVPRSFLQPLGGEDVCTVDRDSVWRGTRALGGSGASMSDVGAVVLIFSMLAVALTASWVGRYPSQ